MEKLPDFQIDNVKVFIIDCIEFLKTKPDKFYDIGCVDPPYGIGATKFSNGTNLNRCKDGYPAESTTSKIKKKNRLNRGSGKLKNRILNTSDCSWDSNIPSKEYFDELFRVCKNLIIWGGNYFDLPPTRGIVCWDKCQPWPNFSQFELAWTSYDKPAAMFRYSNTGVANREKKFHPTQKPVALYKYLLNKYAKAGDKILDTHGGSLSHARACLDMHFDLDICEINKEYAEKGINALKENNQLYLF